MRIVKRVAVDEVLRQHVGRGAVEVVRLIEVQVVGEDLQHVRAALGDVVGQQLDAVDAHQREQRVVPLFKVGLAELDFDGGELALQNPDEKVAAPARRLQEAGVDALGLALDKVEHRFDHPRRGEHLPVVGDAFFDLIRLIGRMLPRTFERGRHDEFLADIAAAPGTGACNPNELAVGGRAPLFYRNQLAKAGFFRGAQLAAAIGRYKDLPISIACSVPALDQSIIGSLPHSGRPFRRVQKAVAGNTQSSGYPADPVREPVDGAHLAAVVHKAISLAREETSAPSGK